MEAQLHPLSSRIIDSFRRGDIDEVRGLLGGMESTDRLRVIFDAFNAREFRLLAMVRAPGSTHDMRPMGIPGMGVYEEPEGYLAFLDEWMDAFANARLELLDVELIEHDERTFWYFTSRQTITGGGSGLETDFIFAGYGETRDSMTAWSVFDRDLEGAHARFLERVAERRGEASGR